MREVILRVPSLAVEDVLDRLLPVVPGGVRELPAGRRQVELIMRGDEIPSLGELARVAGRWPHRLQERSVSDDWRDRRLADYEQDPIGERLVVRPDWAPSPPAGSGLIDIALTESAAFGAGAHPTTRACLELLLARPAGGSFADLGCGTGVLAILASRLGWAPVVAVDVQPGSVQATLANAAENGAVLEAIVADLSVEPPPPADAFAANVPAELHAIVARALSEPLPHLGLLSGIGITEAAGVLEIYAARGLRQSERVERHGWVVMVLERD
jgi:ribosomal protein L11 methyltransferase